MSQAEVDSLNRLARAYVRVTDFRDRKITHKRMRRRRTFAVAMNKRLEEAGSSFRYPLGPDA